MPVKKAAENGGGKQRLGGATASWPCSLRTPTPPNKWDGYGLFHPLTSNILHA